MSGRHERAQGRAKRARVHGAWAPRDLLLLLPSALATPPCDIRQNSREEPETLGASARSFRDENATTLLLVAPRELEARVTTTIDLVRPSPWAVRIEGAPIVITFPPGTWLDGSWRMVARVNGTDLTSRGTWTVHHTCGGSPGSEPDEPDGVPLGGGPIIGAMLVTAALGRKMSRSDPRERS